MVIDQAKMTEYGYWPDRTVINMSIGKTETLVLARLNKTKYGFREDQTDPNMGIAHTEQTKSCL